MGQSEFFLLTVCAGAGVGFFYDFFRVLRLTFRHRDFLVQIEDALYWALAALGVFYFLLLANSGEVRIFALAGVALGMVLYFAALSAFVLRWAMKLVHLFKSIIVAVIKIVLLPIRAVFRILSVPAGFLYRFIKKKLQKFKRCAKIRVKRLQTAALKRTVRKNGKKREKRQKKGPAEV